MKLNRHKKKHKAFIRFHYTLYLSVILKKIIQLSMAAGVPVPRWRIIRGNLTLHCGNPAETRQPPLKQIAFENRLCEAMALRFCLKNLFYGDFKKDPFLNYAGDGFLSNRMQLLNKLHGLIENNLFLKYTNFE